MYNCKRYKWVGVFALVGFLGMVPVVGCATSGGGGGGGGGVNANANEIANENENVNQDTDGNENADENTNENTDESTNENTNEDPSANENESNDNGSSGPGLSAEVSEAVDLVEIELEALAKGLASFMDALDPQAEVGPDDLVTYGSCPTVTAGGATEGVVIILDYGEGCTNDRYGDAVLSGTFTTTVIGQVYGAMVTDFAIDGASLVGTVNATRLEDTEAGATLQGDVAFTSDEIGQGIGTGTFGFNLTRSVITIADAEIKLGNTTDITDTPDTISYDAVFENVVINPMGNGNFTPQSGTLSFEGPGDSGTVIVTYSAESPISGAVDVSVGGAEAVEHDVAGLD